MAYQRNSRPKHNSASPSDSSGHGFGRPAHRSSLAHSNAPIMLASVSSHSRRNDPRCQDEVPLFARRRSNRASSERPNTQDSVTMKYRLMAVGGSVWRRGATTTAAAQATDSV